MSKAFSHLVTLSVGQRKRKRRSKVVRKKLKCVKGDASAETDETYLTKWEEQALANMGWMLKKPRTLLAELEYFYTGKDRQQEMAVPMVADKTSRCLHDLKSLLDYTTYFCHCHFSNKGKPSKTNLRKITFPYTESKKPDIFKKDVKTLIFEYTNDTTSTPHKIDTILEVFLRVQPIVSKEKSDQKEKYDSDQEDINEAYCLNILHNLTAHTTHFVNDSIGFAKKDAYWDVKTESLQYEQNESQTLLPVKKGFFILIPDFRQSSNETGFVNKPLLTQMLQLTKFVAETAQEILKIACENSKDLIDKEFNENRVQGNERELIVDSKRITWEEYDKSSSLMYL